jgi:predicted metalloenzyme YecM
LLSEAMIGGRPISTFRFKIESQGYTVSCVEIPAVKPNSPYQTGFEHVEFVIGNEQSLE